MKTAIYAGSFDPLTNGHIWVIEQGLKLFDYLYIAIGVNSEKKSYFTDRARMEMIREYLVRTGYDKFATVISFENEFLIDVAARYNATTMLRGIRNGKDFEYELEIKMFNEKMNPDINTIFVSPPHELCGVSSSIVRGCVGLANWKSVIKSYTTPYVISKFEERLSIAS